MHKNPFHVICLFVLALVHVQAHAAALWQPSPGHVQVPRTHDTPPTFLAPAELHLYAKGGQAEVLLE